MSVKHLLPIAMALVFGYGATIAQAASDGTIEFTGSISSTTCNIEGTAPGTGTSDKTVDLGTVSVANLPSVGSISSSRGFEIVIGGAGDTGCTDGQTARIRFDPSSPAIDATTGRLNLDAGASPADNVQIELANADGSAINVYTGESQGVTIADNQAVIPLQARYYATGVVTAGSANSRVAFQVIYD